MQRRPFLLLDVICAGFISIVFSAAVAHAGRLTINGISHLEFKSGSDGIEISGSYEIENRGDELAKSVFPAFSLGQWIWSGEPRDIDRDKKTEWNILAKIPTAQLACNEATCGPISLPSLGAFPLLIRRHYSDLNGYRFSAADLQRVVIGDLTEEQNTVARVPPLEATMRVKGDGQEFDATVEIINLSQEPREISFLLHAPREIQILTPPSKISITPGRESTFTAKLKNFSGLPGSDYAALGVIQWEERGIRNTLPVSHLVSIRTVDNSYLYIWAGMAVFVIVLAALYFFVIREPAQ